MRYEYIDIEEVKNNGSKIIRELDQDNENKTEIINEYVLRPSSIKEGISLKSALMALNNLPDDNGSLSAAKRYTEQAYKDVQDKFLNAFERAIKLDEMTEKKEDVLVTDFSEWASYGAKIDIPYTQLAAKALNNGHELYQKYVLSGYFGFLPEEPTYSVSKEQNHSLKDFEDLIKCIIKDGFNYYERANAIIQVGDFVKEHYSYNTENLNKIENSIKNEVIKSDIRLIFEIARTSPKTLSNIQSEDLDFTAHIKSIQSDYEKDVKNFSGLNKTNQAIHSMEKINKLVEAGVFDADISYLQFIGSGMKEMKNINKEKISTIYDVYHSLPSEEMKFSLENTVSLRDAKILQQELKSPEVKEARKSKMRP